MRHLKKKDEGEFNGIGTRKEMHQESHERTAFCRLSTVTIYWHC